MTFPLPRNFLFTVNHFEFLLSFSIFFEMNKDSLVKIVFIKLPFENSIRSNVLFFFDLLIDFLDLLGSFFILILLLFLLSCFCLSTGKYLIDCEEDFPKNKENLEYTVELALNNGYRLSLQTHKIANVE